ncbi:glycosyltransferase [Microterricola viridarii]|uniref:UDP:flavonoid glycosyltransferase YjiC, YdhE family n=1 Tax=Microterricola viridarii TaxID=412690 RepID=A0A1H1U230_9MICO|nr:nucleotide disphospho-sugar-binding domain-containing protein [Microterricola viridarii]SDS66443.1 UDP:flavonoid glycosyltransferase YjiC, YdhE family [Microterricola viridarii]
MASIMIAVMPFVGHVAPMRAVAEAFLADGHRVRVYTGAAHAGAFASLGAGVVPWRVAPDFDEHDLPAAFPALRDRKGPAQMLANVREVFINTAAGQCVDLRAAFDEEPWEVIVADGLSLGAHLASEHTGTPWATVSIVPLTIPSRDLPPPGLGIRPGRGPLGRARDALLRGILPLVSARLERDYRLARSDAGLAPGGRPFGDAWYSPELVCASGVPELDYPRRDLPSQVVYVGTLTPAAAAPPPPGRRPDWLPDAAAGGDPVVHVTQGTLNTEPRDLIQPAFAALGRQRVRLVAVTGRRGRPELPFPAPPNAAVSDVIPYAGLLPHVDVMITNGGWGGVLAALAHGIPLIVAGGDLDKPEIAARVAWAGAGIDLRTGTPSPRQILAAWRRVSADPAFRASAERVGAALRQHDGPAEVVQHTLRLLQARRAPGA